MHPAAILFGAINLAEDDVAGKRILDIGARQAGKRELQGSLKPLIESWGPENYVGVDLKPGENVDYTCDACSLLEKFGRESFDLVLCTEVLEHVRNWRTAISNMKQVCKTGGSLLITTRSCGFPYHSFPNDYWRFQPQDMKTIFSDMKIRALETDPQFPGVFIKAKKPQQFKENNLSHHQLYSIICDCRKLHLEGSDFETMRYLRLQAKAKINSLLSKAADKVSSS